MATAKECASAEVERDEVLRLMKKTLARQREELRGLSPAEKNRKRLLEVEIEDAEQMIRDREKELRALA